jgi:hypothetical protein
MFFRRDVAWTAHSVQGETIVDDYCIFEIDEHFSTWRWFYTAFSRAEYLSKVWIYVGASLFDVEFLNRKIKSKLLGHTRTDKADFGKVSNLTADWVKDKFKKQNFRCAKCSCLLAFNWTEGDDESCSRATARSPATAATRRRRTTKMNLHTNVLPAHETHVLPRPTLVVRGTPRRSSAAEPMSRPAAEPSKPAAEHVSSNTPKWMDHAKSMYANLKGADPKTTFKQAMSHAKATYKK